MHASFVDVESGKKKEIKLSITESESSEGGSNNIDKFTVDDGLDSTKIPSKIDKFLVD
jgi:hypothetical protein